MDKEPHYAIRVGNYLCNDLPGHANSQLVGTAIYGTVDSATNNTMTDTAPPGGTWVVGSLVGRQVEITSFTGQGQIREITANTGTTLTVTPDWGTNPDATSWYQVHCADSYTLGGPRTTTNIYQIPEGQYNFSSFNTYEPVEAKFTPGCNQDLLVVDGLEDTRVYSAASLKSPTHADGIDNDSDTVVDEDGECLKPGDVIGGMRSETDLGLFNGTCTSDVAVDFTFYNIALPNNPDDPRASTNIATPWDEGVKDRIRAIVTDTTPLDGVADGNSLGVLKFPDWMMDLLDPDWRPGLPDEIQVTGTAESGTTTTLVDNAPAPSPFGAANSLKDYTVTITAGTGAGQSRGILSNTGDTLTLRTAWDNPIGATSQYEVAGPQNGPGMDPMAPHNGAAKPVIPTAVYGGIANVATTWTPLYFAQFDDGVLGPAYTDPNHYFNVAQTNMGKLNLAVLTDVTTGVVASSTIADFCSELISRTMLLGTTLGRDGLPSTGDEMIRASHPSVAGTYFTKHWSTSFRDLDNDAYENNIDTCPAVANLDDIRVLAPTGDPDGDRIDSACDPTPGANSGINADGDLDRSGEGFHNAFDNCPLVANPTQTEDENKTTVSPLDGGPQVDALGNECDTGAVAAFQQDGYSPINITMSPSVSNGHYHLTTIVDPYCYGGVDADKDGYCAADQESGQDNNATRHKSWSGSLIDLNAADRDGDLYSDYIESHLGTNPTKACSFSTTSKDEYSSQALSATGGIGSTNPLAHDAWPSDLNDDARSNMTDVIFGFVTSLAPGGLGQDAVPPKNRLDFNGDGYVNMTDVILGYVTKLAPTGLGATCPVETQQ